MLDVIYCMYWLRYVWEQMDVSSNITRESPPYMARPDKLAAYVEPTQLTILVVRLTTALLVQAAPRPQRSKWSLWTNRSVPIFERSIFAAPTSAFICDTIGLP
jgi:hypothetical protein